MPSKLVHCIGCGALVPQIDGPTHRYIGATPGCWAIFGEVLAKEYGEYGYPSVHRLTVDTYAVQHPGIPSRQSIQSVALHLISLYIVLERGFESKVATKAMQRATEYRENFVWLEPPASRGAMTVLDVAQAANLAEHEDLVRRWAASAWDVWSPYHGTIRRWATLTTGPLLVRSS